ncbi:MAG TPA: magnesium chelatase domain-containing protein [Actinomycetota bacterium]|jgi:predicted ATPase with chaperone activity
MDVRIWGVMDDRLIEVVVASTADGDGLVIEGLPEERRRTTRDRVAAALINSRLVKEVLGFRACLKPHVTGSPTSDLDLPLALAILLRVGTFGGGLRSVLATGRLGLDGTVFSRDFDRPTTLRDVVDHLCHTPLLESEHMFGAVEEA